MSGDIMRKLNNALAVNGLLLNECESNIDQLLKQSRVGKLNRKKTILLGSYVNRRKTLIQQKDYLTDAINELECIRTV